MRHGTWYAFFMVILTLFILLGLGNGSMVALYALLSGIDWHASAQEVEVLFLVVPLHLMLGMIIIARWWYGLRMSFAWKQFIVGFVLAVIVFVKGFWWHALVYRLVEKLGMAIISNIGTAMSWHICILAFGQALMIWSVYAMLLLIGYCLIMSMFYALPSTSLISAYGSFVRMNLLSLLMWSVIFGFLQLGSSLLAMAGRIQMIVYYLRTVLLGEQVTLPLSDLYISEVVLKVVLVAGMLWVVVSWFARVERYPKTIE